MTNPLKWRFDIDPEYQGWILLFASVFALNVFCFPCQCAGSQLSCVRRLANYVHGRLPIYLIFAAMFNAAFLYLIVAWMPDWDFKDYLLCVVNTMKFLAKHAAKGIQSVAVIVVFVFVVVFRDRFAKILGIDNKTFVRFKLRDVFGGGRVRAIELQILKVEDLQSKSLFSANNVYLETSLGYNEPMKTRVHNGAGSACTIKETIQLNFDEEEEEDALFIYVKNQKVVGSDELGRLEMTPDHIKALEKECDKKGKNFWAPETFVEKQLLPRGRIWIRLNKVEDDDQKTVLC